MSASEDEDALAFLNLVNLFTYSDLSKRRFWVHPFWRANELNMYQEKFHSFYRMRKETFQLLPRKFEQHLPLLFYPSQATTPTSAISKQDTNFRTCVTPEEHLLITLSSETLFSIEKTYYVKKRYFATGSSFKALLYYFLRRHTTIRSIVTETATVIWET
ncbi:hypothetical protein J437_LFUL014974 [Ladona fulva]|uniref:Uncharacterized protein n=1 Tax=Ladona fulva TaxID=123851 RepID=A0A8K0PAW6_LADFU|nr:hypothetical protein J437_LFUL014974 [Ladona fulva]